jgi:hypothetical protein
MFLLMRYPQLHDVTPIVDLADMIRRGVLDTGAHIGATMNPNEVFDLPSFDPVTDKYRVDTFAAMTPQSASRNHAIAIDSMRKPSWLLGLGKSSSSGGGGSGYHNSSSSAVASSVSTKQQQAQPKSQQENGRPLSGGSSQTGGGGLGYLEGGLRRYSMLPFLCSLVL